jgi:Spy/CpxP family protein refolding chaperone
MKINKITMAIIAAAGLLAACPAVHAQTNGAAAPATRAPRGGGMTLDSIDKAVTLTEAQKPKVQAALDDVTKARKDAQGDRTKMTEARTAFNAKMKEILTPEQYTKFEAMPRPGGRRNAGGGAGGAAPANPPANQ